MHLEDAGAEVQARSPARSHSVDVKLWRLDGHTCIPHAVCSKAVYEKAEGDIASNYPGQRLR